MTISMSSQVGHCIAINLVNEAVMTAFPRLTKTLLERTREKMLIGLFTYEVTL